MLRHDQRYWEIEIAIRVKDGGGSSSPKPLTVGANPLILGPLGTIGRI